MNRQRRAILPKTYAESSDLSESEIPKRVQSARKRGKHGIGKMFHRSLDAVIRSPTSADIDQAKKNVQYGIEILNQIEKELEQARVRLSDLEQQREAVQKDIDLNQSIASSLRNIPDEILSLIFEFYVESDTWASPWVLMSVCHQWRAAAIRTRRIWSRILLTHAVHDPQRPNERRWLGYEACHTIPLLQKALDRAADAPLHISLDFGHRPEASVSGEEDTLSRQLLETLGTSGADRRIFELDAKFASIEWIKKIEFDKFEFSALEMAWLTTSLRNLNACIKKTSPCLRWLHLEKYPGDALDWDLSGMTRLVLLWLSGGQGRVPCGLETIKMIRSASHLTELRVWYLKLPYLPGDESLSIPSLLTLVLLGAEVECKLDLPNLQTLTINSSTVSKSEADPLIFPSLTSMTIIKGGPDGLLHIRAPKPLILDIMIFDTLSLIPTLNGIMNHVILLGHLSIRVLRLTTREINPQSLTDFVGKILHLEEVEFHGLISRPKEFFDDLAGPPPSAKTQLINKKPICTSLKTFRLHIPPIASSTAEKAMMKWFRKAVEARKKGMYPIEEAFYWKTDLEIWVPVL